MDIEQQTLKYVCNLLARREYSRKQLRQKLIRRSHNVALVETLLDKLLAKGLQDDARFTEAFVHCRVQKGQGPLKIRQELHHHGIEQELVDRYLNTIDWLALASKVRVKRFGPSLPREYNEKMRQCRFLHGRGFDSVQIVPLFREITY